MLHIPSPVFNGGSAKKLAVEKYINFGIHMQNNALANYIVHHTGHILYITKL